MNLRRIALLVSTLVAVSAAALPAGATQEAMGRPQIVVPRDRSHEVRSVMSGLGLKANAKLGDHARPSRVVTHNGTPALAHSRDGGSVTVLEKATLKTLPSGQVEARGTGKFLSLKRVGGEALGEREVKLGAALGLGKPGLGGVAHHYGNADQYPEDFKTWPFPRGTIRQSTRSGTREVKTPQGTIPNEVAAGIVKLFDDNVITGPLSGTTSVPGGKVYWFTNGVGLVHLYKNLGAPYTIAAKPLPFKDVDATTPVPRKVTASEGVAGASVKRITEYSEGRVYSFDNGTNVLEKQDGSAHTIRPEK
jgi:hypothetical protein